jgi:deoxyribodipyrimidine photo-lyase
MTATEIVWFRRDLRVHDHPALTAAVRAAERVVPAFVLDDRLLDGRFPSAARAWFLLESLRELREALRARGGDLVIRHGAPERELPALARETGARAVRFAADVSPFATARDRRVEEALRAGGVEVVRHPGTFVADVAEPKPYSVFTPFWRVWRELPRREVHGAPRRITVPPKLRAGEIPHADCPLDDPIGLPGEKAARARMHAFVRDGLERYADRHDRLAGGTSELSPYLHFGCVSARELEQEAGASEAFVRQLCWRDFYAHVLLHNPGNAHRAHQPRMDALEWEDDDEALAAWQQGRTGFPVVDAAMRQLLAQGWMHNRGRLIAGSFLTKDLHVDWRRGEAHFMRRLLCGDEAQNNGNWQWVSSVGVDPAPYFRRLYNPVLQQQRHDRDGEYVRRWVPELRDVPLEHLAEPWKTGLAPEYPAPIVDHAQERRRAIARYRAAGQG